MSNTAPLPVWGELRLILEKIFAPLQVALLALAIQLKFMRWILVIEFAEKNDVKIPIKFGQKEVRPNCVIMMKKIKPQITLEIIQIKSKNIRVYRRSSAAKKILLFKQFGII